MEEVDSIILHFLQQIQINIDENIKNICDLTIENIIESSAKCLNAINPALKVPTKLPTGISHRIEVASQIASICKDIGYQNDVGYQTFLYHNEADLRQVFMFLIERLPNDSQQVLSKTTYQNSLLKQNIRIKINEEFNHIWIPPCCNDPQQKLAGDYKNQDPQNFKLTHLSEEELIQKILKNQCFNKTCSLQNKSTDGNSVAEVLDSINETNKYSEFVDDNSKSLKELKEMAIVLRQKLDALESEKYVMDVEYSQALKSCEKVELDLNNIYNILSSIGVDKIDSDKITVGNTLENVQRNINGLHNKSESITSNNLSLKLEVDKFKSRLASSESERSKCKKTLVDLKEAAKALKEEYQMKEIIKNQHKQIFEKLKKGNKRAIYTKRILEIISNVDKQNMEIKKILEDTRQIQKEINSLEGQLDRCFTLADETLFRDAKKDDQAKKAYKLLALLHSECNTIVSLVNDTGIVARDIVDLEDNIKTEVSKKTEDTLAKIKLDLTQMQKELQ